MSHIVEAFIFLDLQLDLSSLTLLSMNRKPIPDEIEGLECMYPSLYLYPKIK